MLTTVLKRKHEFRVRLEGSNSKKVNYYAYYSWFKDKASLNTFLFQVCFHIEFLIHLWDHNFSYCLLRTTNFSSSLFSQQLHHSKAHARNVNMDCTLECILAGTNDGMLAYQWVLGREGVIILFPSPNFEKSNLSPCYVKPQSEL